MEAVILIGIQGSGKSTFYRRRFFDTHIRINLDMLRTRHRERVMVEACLRGKQPFVVDNTNPTRQERSIYIEAGKAAKFRIVGYYFPPDVEAAKRRNVERSEGQVVPLPGLLGTLKRLEVPKWDEEFDELYAVHIDGNGDFKVEPIPRDSSPPEPSA